MIRCSLIPYSEDYFMALPFTYKMLQDWAGWKSFRDGKALFDRGVVQKIEYVHPLISGELAIGVRGMRTKFELLPDGMVDNHCPCRENQERGVICCHLVALGLAAIQLYSDPFRQEKEQKEKQRAVRLQQVDESNYLCRVPATHPKAVSAILRLALEPGWREQAEGGRFPVRCLADFQGRRLPLNEIPPGTPLSFTPRDENLLFVIEDICEGPAGGRFIAGEADFINLLQLCVNKPILDEEQNELLTVLPEPIGTRLRMELDEMSGELNLSMNLDPSQTGEKPLFIIGAREGWAFSGKLFRKLNELLPVPLRSIYHNPTRIARPSVPKFMNHELPALGSLIPVDTDISADLFSLTPAEPRFRLLISGSPASLSAKLYAEYDHIHLVAGRDEVAGNFAIPDSGDLFEYRVRNPAAEKKALEKLAQSGFSGHRGDLLTPIVGHREVLNFLGGAIPRLRRYGWRIELEGRVSPFMDEAEFTTPVIRISETSGGGFFDVGYSYENTTGQSLSESEIQRALNMGEAFVEKNGRTVLLDIDAIETAREVFSDCAFGAGSEAGMFRMNDIYAAYVQSALHSLDGVDVEASPDWLKKAQTQNRTEKIEPEELGEALESTLRAYQKEGVYWLRYLERSGFCGILADEMGLGKTLQALTWIQLERHNEKARGKPVLIVCPTSLVENWAEEAARFTPALRVLKMHGSSRHEHWEALGEKDLVITSYALLRRDLDEYVKHEFAIAVLDEAQHIKNRTTQNSVAAKKIRTLQKLVLTGTPIENSVADLWSIMDFLMPGYLGHHKAFREHYELPIGHGGPDGELAQLKLRRKLHPFLLRRLKRDVARELPEKIQRVAHCALSKDQFLVYRELLENSKRKINDLVQAQGFNRSRMQIFKTLLRLRQTCCHLDLLKLPNLKSEFPSAKMDLFFELVDEAVDAGHRILVFSQFTSMLAILRKELDDRELKYCYLDGATKNRQDMVKEFNTNRFIPVFLISLKAGGSGLNLTGADMVIHYDPWWNPAVEDQATDRAHRIGQKNTVYSVKLITKDTVEEKVLQMQQRKQGVISATLEKEGEFMQSLSWNDVQELLSL
ncbi:MAG: DEAD/DEAH box helicase [Pontiellaceae bacterium]|jgi:superfamily II DNA or RNA helicase|nr:DEAD/DEAH box helicase [Pontiellaceae bacterium]